jgi:hypothetical protein
VRRVEFKTSLPAWGLDFDVGLQWNYSIFLVQNRNAPYILEFHEQSMRQDAMSLT